MMNYVQSSYTELNDRYQMCILDWNSARALGSSEPSITDAASCMFGRFAQEADFAKFCKHLLRRPIADIQRLIPMPQSQPALPTFAATANSGGVELAVCGTLPPFEDRG